MSLSCKGSLLKGNTVVIKGKKTLIATVNEIENTKELEKILSDKNEELEMKISETELKCEELIKSAKDEADNIIEISRSQSSDIEKKAYEEGYNQGLKNGYEDGYKEAYEENIEKARQEVDSILNYANEILLESKNQVVNYMKENQSNILALSISIAEKVLRCKFEETSSLDNLIISAIEEYNLKENFVIKVNTLYKESLDSEIMNLKENHKINKDVFIIGDDSIECGNAIIDTSNGRLSVGIDNVLDKIKEEIL